MTHFARQETTGIVNNCQTNAPSSDPAAEDDNQETPAAEEEEVSAS